MLNDKNVLITGGTGSFGKKCTEIILERYKPRRLIIFSRDELKQFEMAQQFPESKYDYIRDQILGVIRKFFVEVEKKELVRHIVVLEVDKYRIRPFSAYDEVQDK